MEQTFFGIRAEQFIDLIQTVAILAALGFSFNAFRRLLVGRTALVDAIVQQTRILESMAKRLEAIEKRQGVMMIGNANDHDELVQVRRFVAAIQRALNINDNEPKP